MNQVQRNLNPILRQGGDEIVQCPLCGGKKALGTTTYSVDLGQGVVVVRSVPAYVCSQCGEEWIDAQTARVLEEIVSEAKKRTCQVEILSFLELSRIRKAGGK